ncbi:hypothetical protein BGZ89_001478 [Linnemannia elongata]|nr:hypothetical protein BGZ89_001478 [Linnemannia elongata]
MNWTGGRRTKIQATAERMRQQQRFDRQRRLAMTSYDQDLQQSLCIIPEHVQGPSHSPFTASHRTFYPCNEKFSPLLVKKETGGDRTTRSRDAHLAQRKDPICRTDVLLSRASLVSGRSTQGNTSLVASGLDLSTMDYHTARLECLKILKSPSFDWLGEAYQLRPSELLERDITPPSQTSRIPRKRSHPSSGTKRTDHEGRVRDVEDDDVGYSQSDSGADDEDEDDEDEPLQVPANHKAVCRELRNKSRRTDVDIENMAIQPQESSAEEIVIETPPHPTDITKVEAGQDRVTQVDEGSLSRILTPVHSETIAEHQTGKLVERNAAYGMDMPSKSTRYQSAALLAVEPNPPASVSADSSTPLDQAMPVAKETQIQAETSSQTHQSVSAAPKEINEPQEPIFPRETENRGLETRDIEIQSAPPPTTDAQATGLHAIEASPAIVDDTCPRTAEPLASGQPATTPRAAKSPSLNVMCPTSHTTENTVALPHPTSVLLIEARPSESPTSHVMSALRSTSPHSLSSHGSDNLLERRCDNNSGVTSVHETEQRPVEVYSQSVPSEMDAPLYSDDEKTPYQSNNHHSIRTNTCNNSHTYTNRKNSINQEDDYVDPDEVSPEVSTQYTLSKQSSITSAFDWFPANQEQAARISLQEQEHPSQSTLMRSNASKSQAVGNSGYHYDDYDFGGGSFSFRRRSLGVHAQEQEQERGRHYQHAPLIRLPSDPWDVDALGPLLGSQDEFGYNHRRGGSTGSGRAFQGLERAFERGESAEGGEDDALSEWIHDDEW